jgi:preprotein translocase subunit SecF
MPGVEVELRTGLRCECGVMVLYFARFTSLSALVILLVTTLLLATKGLSFAVHFMGGMIIQVHYPEAIASKSVQDTLVRAGLADASVKEISGYPAYFFIVFPPRDEVLSPQTAPLVLQRVIAALRTEPFRVEATRVEIVTPKVGGEVLLLGSAALILVCVAIMIYPAVRYGWRVGQRPTFATW